MHNPELLEKKRIIGISQMDLADEESEKKLKKLNPGIPVVHFSAVTGAGISELKDAIWGQLNSGN
jgi:GTP-binding protein